MIPTEKLVELATESGGRITIFSGFGDCRLIQITPEQLTNFVESLLGDPVAWKDINYGNLHKTDWGDCIPLYALPKLG